MLTKNLGQSEMKNLAEAMKPEKFQKDDVIIKYGDQGQTYYILANGNVKVIVYSKGTDPKDPNLDSNICFTKLMDPGCGFGELALLYNDKRSATIQATEECDCYSLDGTLFKQIVIKASMEKRDTRQRFLNSIKLFDSIDNYQKLKLIDGLQSLTLKQNEFVFYEGDDGDEFYIIE